MYIASLDFGNERWGVGRAVERMNLDFKSGCMHMKIDLFNYKIALVVVELENILAINPSPSKVNI